MKGGGFQTLTTFEQPLFVGSRISNATTKWRQGCCSSRHTPTLGYRPQGQASVQLRERCVPHVLPRGLRIAGLLMSPMTCAHLVHFRFCTRTKLSSVSDRCHAKFTIKVPPRVKPAEVSCFKRRQQKSLPPVKAHDPRMAYFRALAASNVALSFNACARGPFHGRLAGRLVPQGYLTDSAGKQTLLSKRVVMFPETSFSSSLDGHPES